MHVIQEMTEKLMRKDIDPVEVKPFHECNGCLSIVTREPPARLLAKLLLEVEQDYALDADIECERIQEICEKFAFDGMKLHPKGSETVIYFPDIDYDGDSQSSSPRAIAFSRGT